jgi:hypothetical protein
MTTRYLSVIVFTLLLSGCGNIQGQLDNEKISSLRYDNVDCSALVAQRNQAAAEVSRLTGGQGYQDPNVVTGFGPFLPDYRTENQKKAGSLQGQADSMTRSIERRKCAA